MNNFSIDCTTTTKPSNNKFHLHTHDSYEMFLFLEGDSKYVVEGESYNLEPHDMILIRKHQMHRIYHNSCTQYSRLVLMVHPDFFIENNCAEYERQYIENTDMSNKIGKDIVHSSGIYNAFLRLKKYSNGYSDIYNPVCRAIVTEILYLLNNINTFSVADNSSEQLKTIISYINEKYTENLSLDELEKKFYISKYHLCHVFKQATGLTVHKYITQKRLTKAKELTDEGLSLSEAAMLAGFGNYSSFYRAYIQKFNTPPKEKNL